MKKKIAIHHYPGDFSERWIEYCKINHIDYSLINCKDNNIIKIMNDYDILLWSWNLSDFSSLQFARELTYSLEQMGKIVFPNFKTSFFYDNKVGQKYLLESINVPFIKSNIFYKKQDAISWIQKTNFPKVFKLSGGAGSQNVKLCKNKEEAIKLTNIAFGKGFAQVDRITWFKDAVKRFSMNKSKKNILKLLKSTIRLLVPTKKEKEMDREKGYIYFQEFIENNTFDIRVIVIGDKAFALKRLCRKDDFRASGSGRIIYDKNQIDINCIKIALDTSAKLDVQCMAYDFVFDNHNNPLIVEVSYHFDSKAYDNCEGTWNRDLIWIDEKVNPQTMIINNTIHVK